MAITLAPVYPCTSCPNFSASQPHLSARNFARSFEPDEFRQARPPHRSDRPRSHFMATSHRVPHYPIGEMDLGDGHDLNPGYVELYARSTRASGSQPTPRLP